MPSSNSSTIEKRRKMVAKLFENAKTKAEVTDLAGVLVAASIRGLSAHLVAGTIREYVKVPECGTFSHKTVIAARDRSLANETKTRAGRLGRNFDLLVIQWIRLQRLVFKVLHAHAHAPVRTRLTRFPVRCACSCGFLCQNAFLKV